MFKIFQKLQAKITDYEKGWAAIGASIITGLSTAIGVTVGGLAVKGITLGLLVIGVWLFANALNWAFLDFGLRILKWGMGGPFGNMSMTNPINNPIIQIGWTLLRDLTNMFFILGLAYIGLATALNFGNKFNTGKTFRNLLIIALLVNFTPVICGLIVDGTNIIMNFFLSEVNFDQIADSYKTLQPLSGITDVSEKTAVDNIIPFTIKGTLVGVYAVIAGFVMTVFGAILLMRHFIIWILVILSPAAFFLWIFDFSKKYFQKWWGWFIDWSFIGVPAAFFLYLANHLMLLARTKQLPATDQANQLSVGLTPYFVTVVFMVIALVVTLKINKAGSSIIMNTANKVAGKAKSVPGLIQNKAVTPMVKNANAKLGALAAGAFAMTTAKGRANYKSAKAAGGSGIKSVTQAGVIAQREGQQRRATLQEKLGIKPRELEDISEEDLKKVASTPATTQEGMIRRAKAIKKLVDDENFDFNGVQAEEALALMKQYPGMNIDKLKKARPELAYLVDTKGYEKELTNAGGPGNEDLARFNMTKNTAKKMSIEQLSKIPFKDFKGGTTLSAAEEETNIMLCAMFAGLTAAKIDKIAESGNPENLSALKRFATPGTDERAALMTNLYPGAPEWPSLIPVITAINSNPAFV